MIKEAKLREMIKRDIKKLKDTLVLQEEKEKKLLNEFGASGKIDLYAKDERGRHVIIELKRSNDSAREALHEVIKYVELLKSNLGVKDTEIHVIIASTTWHELLLPFSRFVHDMSFSVEGLHIELNQDNTDFNAKPVECLPISDGRLISTWHQMLWFSNNEALEAGIAEIKSCYQKKGVEDYIYIILKTEDIETYYHKYIVYIALKLLSQEECIQILSKDKSLLASVLEEIEDMDDEEVLYHLHTNIEILKPSPKYDYCEIGYPAKFRMLLSDWGFKICSIYKNGVFNRNNLLSDETIMSELSGEDGATGQIFKRTITIAEPSSVLALKKDTAKCLENNAGWKHHIMRIIDEVHHEFPNSKIDVSIFNPSIGVFTVYFARVKENAPLFIPTYYIIVNESKVVRMYFGALQDNGCAVPFQEVLRKYYFNDVTALLVSMTWGGKDSRDVSILEDMGLSYRSFYVHIDGESRNFYVLKDDIWKPCSPTSHIELFQEYVAKNLNLVHGVVKTMRLHCYDEDVIRCSPVTMLDSIANSEQGKFNEQYYLNMPEECDICYCNITDDKYMVDGAMRNNSPWAHMCADCFELFGEGIAWGQGQLYLRNEKGWLLVAGGSDGNYELY